MKNDAARASWVVLDGPRARNGSTRGELAIATLRWFEAARARGLDGRRSSRLRLITLPAKRPWFNESRVAAVRDLGLAWWLSPRVPSGEAFIRPRRQAVPRCCWPSLPVPFPSTWLIEDRRAHVVLFLAANLMVVLENAGMSLELAFQNLGRAVKYVREGREPPTPSEQN